MVSPPFRVVNISPLMAPGGIGPGMRGASGSVFRLARLTPPGLHDNGYKQAPCQENISANKDLSN
jgi:hypothetical protein